VHSGHDEQAPAQWLVEHRALLKPGRALDLACGKGRNAIYLAQAGFQVEAWDRDQSGLERLREQIKTLGLSNIQTRLVDLEREPDLQPESFDLILVFYYLQRDLIPNITKALAPGGLLVYETFLIDNHERFHHPRRREFCLAHNELLSLFSSLRTLAYREDPRDPDRGPFVASLIAERGN
jgi:SAM-dependent methyltransferase